jgi:hypothetical protein
MDKAISGPEYEKLVVFDWKSTCNLKFGYVRA